MTSEFRQNLAASIVRRQIERDREMLPRTIMYRMCKAYGLEKSIKALEEIGLGVERSGDKHPVEYYVAKGNHHHGSWSQILRRLAHHQKMDAFSEIIGSVGKKPLAIEAPRITFRYRPQVGDLEVAWARNELGGTMNELATMMSAGARPLTLTLYFNGWYSRREEGNMAAMTLAIIEAMLPFISDRIRVNISYWGNVRGGQSMLDFVDFHTIIDEFPKVKEMFVSGTSKVKFVNQTKGEPSYTMQDVADYIMMKETLAIKEETV